MPTYTSQPDEASGIDTFIQSNAATTNRGTATGLEIGENSGITKAVSRALIKFDLSPIPSTAIISSATLTITPESDRSNNARTLSVYRQKRAWVETEATWNIYSTGNNWQTAGGFGANDCEQTSIGHVSISASQTVNVGVDISLTASAIQEIVNGTWTNNGFLLKVDTEANDQFVYYSSGAATASYRPKLVIEYTVPVNGVPVTFISEFGML